MVTCLYRSSFSQFARHRFKFLSLCFSYYLSFVFVVCPKRKSTIVYSGRKSIVLIYLSFTCLKNLFSHRNHRKVCQGTPTSKPHINGLSFEKGSFTKPHSCYKNMPPRYNEPYEQPVASSSKHPWLVAT